MATTTRFFFDDRKAIRRSTICITAIADLFLNLGNNKEKERISTEGRTLAFVNVDFCFYIMASSSLIYSAHVSFLKQKKNRYTFNFLFVLFHLPLPRINPCICCAFCRIYTVYDAYVHFVYKIFITGSNGDLIRCPCLVPIKTH